MSLQTLVTKSIQLANLIATGGIGESHSIELSTWLKIHEDARGGFWNRVTHSYRAPKLAIVQGPATFLTLQESALVIDGVRGQPVTSQDSTPFVIGRLARQNWNCVTRMPDGAVLVRTSVAEDFTLTLSATIPRPSALLSTLGGYARVRVTYPGSRPVNSPCTGLPDLTGRNVTATLPNSVAASGPFYLKPAPLAGRAALPASSRVEFKPSRINWEYWNAEDGFGPRIVHEAYDRLGAQAL